MKSTLNIGVRKVGSSSSVIDLSGEITGFSEATLMDGYSQASNGGVANIVLNFERLEYMNSSGIGLLVTLLIRTRRQNQRLLAYGLNEHYQHIFELTRLNEAIQLYGSETEALSSIKSLD